MAQHPSTASAAFLCAFLLFSSVANSQEYDGLDIQGDKYENACTVSEKKRLKDEISRSAAKNKAEARRAIEALLCSSRNALDLNYLIALFPPRVKLYAQATAGEPKSQMIKIQEEDLERLLANTKAWGAIYRIGASNIEVEYYPNASCIRSITLSNSRDVWIVRKLDEACD